MHKIIYAIVILYSFVVLSGDFPYVSADTTAVQSIFQSSKIEKLSGAH